MQISRIPYVQLKPGVRIQNSESRRSGWLGRLFRRVRRWAAQREIDRALERDEAFRSDEGIEARGEDVELLCMECFRCYTSPLGDVIYPTLCDSCVTDLINRRDAEAQREKEAGHA
jgi:hypothetical protein